MPEVARGAVASTGGRSVRRGSIAGPVPADESDEAMKTRVIFYLIGGVLLLGAGLSSLGDGASVPDLITIACGVLILALAGWQYSRSHGADQRSPGDDVERPHR